MQHNRNECHSKSSPERNKVGTNSIGQMSSLLNPDDPGPPERWVGPRMSIFAGMPGLASVGVGLDDASLPHRLDVVSANVKDSHADGMGKQKRGDTHGAEDRESDMRNNGPQNWGELKTKVPAPFLSCAI